MNPVLHVKLRFTGEKRKSTYGPRNLKKGNEVTIEKIDGLIQDLRRIQVYYAAIPKYLNGMLVDVSYNDIIAKTNRIKQLLKSAHGEPNDEVVGARFTDASPGKENHIITYYVNENAINDTIRNLQAARELLNAHFGRRATPQTFNRPACKIKCSGYGLTDSTFRNIIVDASVVEKFNVPSISNIPDKQDFVITFYKTELPLSDLLDKIQLDRFHHFFNFLGNDTISANRDVLNALQQKIPYMISMVSSDLSAIELEDFIKDSSKDKPVIPHPTTEPTIGVIDTYFDDTVYFNEWVSNTDYLDSIDELDKLSIKESSRIHGTQVTSLIVDGPRLNPWLDDGCGRFRVRHFGVCDDKISVIRLMRKIEQIVISNPDIHVWNLSLGNVEEVSKNFISYSSAILDDLQNKLNVLFVIAGTNDNRDEKDSPIRIGDPADSINAIVVNSVRRDRTPASYSRKGNVLSFFNKPDVSYYGGDIEEPITAYSSDGEVFVNGTSFAAPWISRKLCYLIDIMGMTREVAKAMIIDAAAGWTYKTMSPVQLQFTGYGIVPIRIEDIVSSNSDEFKVVLNGVSSFYKTANYAIPIPKDENGKYPYIARATLCYFPKCNRNQGVDYTDRELSLKFGRVKKDDTIEDINDNIQDDPYGYVDERQSRKDFRKWENTKIISKVVNNNKPLKAYEDRLWGLSIISKERTSSSMKTPLNFGVVLTMKEINSVNRIQDFISACELRGWIINKLNVENQLEVYNVSQEELLLE